MLGEEYSDAMGAMVMKLIFEHETLVFSKKPEIGVLAAYGGLLCVFCFSVCFSFLHGR